MTEAQTDALLHLENVCVPRARSANAARTLFVSLNPDLVNDFGHFLNYEKRIREVCDQVGLVYRCFASQRVAVNEPDVLPVFTQDSGHFSLMRRASEGQEAAIAQSFVDTVHEALGQVDPDGQFERVHVFCYCGSSRLASRLAECAWDPRIQLCMNAFWDFLLKERHYRDVAVLPFQRQVRLLAMSDLHQAEIQDASGLHFDFIPNPPPLLHDRQAYDALHAQAGGLHRQRQLQVLIPGLMTMGKGKETTGGFFDHVRTNGDPAWRFVFRDRQRQLGDAAPPRVTVVNGDLTDGSVADLYRASDVVVLPYEPATFGVRTSGALVDCLVFGAVPLVHCGTWLAHVCESLGVGRVLPDMHPDTLLGAIDAVMADLPAERARVLMAGGRYLAVHNWGRLFDLATAEPATSLPGRATMPNPPEASALAAANRLFRDRRFAEAARIYAWLGQSSDFDLHHRNLRLCERLEVTSRAA